MKQAPARHLSSMESTSFIASLLRASAGGFAALAVNRTLERSGEAGELDGSFDAWRAQFQDLVLELASAVADGSQGQFASKVGWVRDALMSRGLQIDFLRSGLEELGAVLEESLPDNTWPPLSGFMAAASQELDRTSSPDDVRGADHEPLGEIASAYLAHILEGDGAGAIDLVVSAIQDNQLSVPDALEEVLTPVLREVGHLWHEGVLNVAEEHFASQTAGRNLELIVQMAPKPPAFGRTVVLTMVEGDAHDIGLRIVAAFFELDGWRTICLGANTPAIDLALSAQSFDADLVVIGATLNTQRADVVRALEVLKKARPDQKILIGGNAFSELEGRADEFGASVCALVPRDAVRLGRGLFRA
ncbi:MAG: methanogenic corrinoid protein MtbC1 [Planctomycetota bacterium]|jgi:methanogenic corrinoid protein MtbC1